MKIGFVGLGNMGAHMAQNLGKSGHKIFGYDVIKKQLRYVNFQNNIQDACNDMDVVITMLPDGKALKEDQNFLEGLNIFKGSVTHKAVADVFGYKYVSPKEIIKNV